MSLPKVTRQHVGVLGMAGCLAGFVLSLHVSTQVQEQYSRFQPVEGNGWRFSRYVEPVSSQPLGVAGMFVAGAAAAALICVDVEGRPLFDLETCDQDAVEALDVVGAYATYALAHGFKRAIVPLFTQTAKASRSITVRCLPTEMRDRLAKKAAQTGWFDRFLKSPHQWVVGKTHSGKTVLVSRLLRDFIAGNPEGQFVICDTDYGKRGYNWGGLPLSYIRRSPEDIQDEVLSRLEDMEERAASDANAAANGKPNTKGWPKVLIIICEWNSLVTSLGGSKGAFYGAVKELLIRGNGYGYQILLDGQTCATGETDISEAIRQQLSIAILGENATKPKEVGKLGATNTAELIADVAALKKRGHRAAIAEIAGEAQPVAVVVPDLSDVVNLRFDVPQRTDPDRDWWEGACTPALAAQVQEMIAAYHNGDRPSPLKDAAALFGLQTRQSDRRYADFFKPWYDTILEDTRNVNS